MRLGMEIVGPSPSIPLPLRGEGRGGSSICGFDFSKVGQEPCAPAEGPAKRDPLEIVLNRTTRTRNRSQHIIDRAYGAV